MRDRDDEPINTVDDQLNDLNYPGPDNFLTLKWRRRHLESYLIAPEPVGRAIGRDPDEVSEALAEHFALAIPSSFTERGCAEVLLQANGKDILMRSSIGLLANSGQEPHDVALTLGPAEVCEDIRTFFARLHDLSVEPPEDGDLSVDR